MESKTSDSVNSISFAPPSNVKKSCEVGSAMDDLEIALIGSGTEKNGVPSPTTVITSKV